MTENTQSKEAADQAKQDAADLDEFATTDQPREGAGKAIVHILLGALIFAGGTAAYLWEANRSHQAQSLVLEARPLVELADVASLNAAIVKYDEALAVKGGYEKAIAGNAEAYTLLWVDHGLENFKPQALDYINQAVDDDIQRGERYGAVALAAYGEGRMDEAVNVTKEILDKGGVSERLNWTLGLALRAQGDLKKGRDNLRKAQDSKSGAPHYAVSLANAYDEDGNHHNAAHFWAIANTVNSNYVPAAASHVIGQARKAGDPKVLRDELDRLSKMPPDHLGKKDLALIELARSEVFFHLAQTGEAVKSANKTIELGGESAPNLFARGRALIADGKVELGFKDLEAARAKVPAATRYFYETAIHYYKTGKYDQALKVLKEPERRAEHVNEPKYHVLIGDILREKGESDKAAASYDKALKIQQEYAEAFLGHGVNLWRKKDYDGSLKWFEKAVAARSQYPEVYEAIGMMWFEQRAGDQANIQLEEAERQLYKAKVNRIRLGEFYAKVLKTLVANRASSTHVNQWVEKEKAFREAQKTLNEAIKKKKKAPKKK